MLLQQGAFAWAALPAEPTLLVHPLYCCCCCCSWLLQGSSQGHWRFPGHAVEQGYAYILTHPGTPCVFWDHLSDQRLRDTVGRLVACRKRNGLNCRSAVRRGVV